MNASIVSFSTRAIAPNTTIAQAPALVGILVFLGSLIVASHVGSWSENSIYACISRAPDSPIAPVKAAITASASLSLRDRTILLAVSSERGDTNAVIGFLGL